MCILRRWKDHWVGFKRMILFLDPPLTKWSWLCGLRPWILCFNYKIELELFCLKYKEVITFEWNIIIWNTLTKSKAYRNLCYCYSHQYKEMLWYTAKILKSVKIVHLKSNWVSILLYCWKFLYVHLFLFTFISLPKVICYSTYSLCCSNVFVFTFC